VILKYKDIFRINLYFNSLQYNTFIPSTIAICWVYIKEKSEIRYIFIFSGILLLAVLTFGILRIDYNSEENSIKAGLVVLEEKYHDLSKQPDYLRDTIVAALYTKEISKLAEQGAKLIVLPERAININKEAENIIIGSLGNVAKQNQVYIFAGYTNFEISRNLILL
jgi:apolipoprotein N-acyltransferase